MARLDRAIRGNWVRSMKPRDTASDILERIIKAYQKDKRAANKKAGYTMREFSQEQSVDTHGTEASSPMFTLDKNSLSLLDKKEVDERLLRANYINYCNQIEQILGAPNLPPSIELTGNPEIRTPEQIKERLEKFRKREKFELKLLREIYPAIRVTQNRATKIAIAELTWLYNSGKSRDQGAIAIRPYEALFDREKDKLFYVRKLKQYPMLHKCGDEAILERISHLTWIFIKGSPFKKAKGVPSAISRLI